MVNRYRRAARAVAELGLGWLAPLCDAIPELKTRRAGVLGASRLRDLASASQARAFRSVTNPALSAEHRCRFFDGIACT
jgi:hypothetical protein